MRSINGLAGIGAVANAVRNHSQKQALAGSRAGLYVLVFNFKKRRRTGKPLTLFLTALARGSGAMAQDSASLTARLALGSLAVGIAVLALKGVAAYLTGSIALYSDALESVVNVVTAIVALVAVRLAARPADAALPYGYGKAEYFSAVIIGVFIAVAALLIFTEAWRGFVNPEPFRADPVGIGVSVLATEINGVGAFVLLRAGRRDL